MTQHRRDEKTGLMAKVVSSTYEYKIGFTAGEKAGSLAQEPVAVKATDHTPVSKVMGSLREALARMENCFEYLAATRTDEIYTAMIDGGQTQALLDLDAARRNAREVLSATATDDSPASTVGPDEATKVLQSIIDYNGTFPNLPGEIIERARRVILGAGQ